MIILPFLTIFLSLLLGHIVTSKLSLEIPKFSKLFYIPSIGIVLFTAISYFFCLLFSFTNGIIVAEIFIFFFEVFYIFVINPILNPLIYFQSIVKEKFLVILLIVIGSIIFLLLNHHILLSKNGDIYTGESTYGDLPFHLSTIANIAFGQKFPPDNPMYAHRPLVYPYFINFFSAILVYQGLSLRYAVIIPGFILSLSLIGLIYDFAFTLTKNPLKSFLSTILYFFNGGLGFYFFLKDYSFSPTFSIKAIMKPSALKEYSHLFEQNIQWGNFLSRMIVPERALLFGLPIGIIFLRLLFFRGNQSKIHGFDLIVGSFLLSLMPLLHTHTFLVMILIIPILVLFSLKKAFLKQGIKFYFLTFLLAAIFAIPHTFLFLNHIDQSQHFMRLHLWWMKQLQESVVWFWFKNTYLLIPLSLVYILSNKTKNKSVFSLQICGLVLFVLINTILFSPYDWDNVKFLFWIGLFLDIAVASIISSLFTSKKLVIQFIVFIITLSMVSTSLLSIIREINVSYLLFSKEALIIGEKIKNSTPKNVVFLTYKIHNSPVNNLAGRSIMMGYPDLLWTQGINYSQRENDINKIFAGKEEAKSLIQKYRINFVVLENYQPDNLFINRNFFNQYPIIIGTNNYTVYKVE